MKNCCLAIPAGVCLLAGSLAGCSSEPKESASVAAAPTPAPAPTAAPTPAPVAYTPQQPLTVEESLEGSMAATVRTIDHATRVVTLRDGAGNEQTFTVDPAVRRLNEVHAGDTVRLNYSASILAELRPPTSDEAANPIAIVELGGRAPQEYAPAAGVGQAVRVVTTVEAVDVPNMRVTLRGPLGDTAVVRGKKRENFERLRIGDTIVITYARAVVLSLEKTGR